ncbi:MAG TPA: site-specific integrase [Gemmataceae bacterium]|nr:site-specific integrase [Gemmataceae bacterium]
MRNGEPKIWLAQANNSPFWVIRYIDPETGRTLQKSTGTTKKKEAERKLGEFRADLLNGRYAGPANATWPTFREKYDADILSGFAPATVKKIDTVLDAVERILKPKRMGDLTASRISTFVAKLREGGRRETTIASYLAHLHAALSWAVSVKLLSAVPKIKKPKRAKLLKKPKGRAPTEEEFKKILAVIPEVIGSKRAASWRHFYEGLWWSGLRLGEALELWWDRDDRLCIDLTQGRPLLRIPAELEKGHQDRLLPIAPEFAEFLLRTPEEQRTGRVFKPEPEKTGKKPLTIIWVIKIMALIGEKSGVVVHVDPKTGKKKYASAHDFRRAFGDRWALRVMPPVLMQLMRHESIETTMRFYVGRSVQATADVVWEAYERAKEQPRKESSPLRDTLRDTQGVSGNGRKGADDANSGVPG